MTGRIASLNGTFPAWNFKEESAGGRVAVWDMQQGLKVGWGII